MQNNPSNEKGTVMAQLISLDQYRVKTKKQLQEKRYQGGRCLAAIQDLPFTKTEKPFLNYLASIQDFTGDFMEAKQRRLETMAEKTGYSISTLKRVSKSLHERGYIRKYMNTSRGLRVSSSYQLTEKLFIEYEQLLAERAGQKKPDRFQSIEVEPRRFVSAQDDLTQDHPEPAQAHSDPHFIPLYSDPSLDYSNLIGLGATDMPPPELPEIEPAQIQPTEKEKIIELLEDCFRDRPKPGYEKGYCNYDLVNAGINQFFPKKDLVQIAKFTSWLVELLYVYNGSPLNPRRFYNFWKAWTDGVPPHQVPMLRIK